MAALITPAFQVKNRDPQIRRPNMTMDKFRRAKFLSCKLTILKSDNIVRNFWTQINRQPKFITLLGTIFCANKN